MIECFLLVRGQTTSPFLKKPSQRENGVLPGSDVARDNVALVIELAYISLWGGVEEMVRIAMDRLKERPVDANDSPGLGNADDLLSREPRSLRVLQYCKAEDVIELIIGKGKVFANADNIGAN